MTATVRQSYLKVYRVNCVAAISPFFIDMDNKTNDYEKAKELLNKILWYKHSVAGYCGEHYNKFDPKLLNKAYTHKDLLNIMSFVTENLSSDKVIFQCSFHEPEPKPCECRDYYDTGSEVSYCTNIFEPLDVDLPRFKNCGYFSLKKFSAVDNEHYIVKEIFHDSDSGFFGTAIFQMTKERFLSFKPYIPRGPRSFRSR